MSLLRVVFTVVFAIISIVFGERICQINDCEAPPNTYPICNVSESLDWIFYLSEKQNDLLIDDPNHVFYIINDPQEVDCLTVRLLVHVTGVVLHVYCRIDDDSTPVPIGLEPTPAEQQPTCFKRNAYRLCGVNTSERLRMTLLRDRELLLLEDFSDGVPKGSWLLLQKDERTKNGPCKCPRWERMIENYEKCFNEHDQE